MKAIEREVKTHTSSSGLKEIKLRPDQLRLVQSAIKKRRGLIVAPTGSGKTVVAASVVKHLGDTVGLFLCPRLSIGRQTVDEFRKFGFDSVGFIGEGQKAVTAQINVATIQSAVTLDFSEIGHLFDWVIVDEAHLAFGTNGTCEKILREIPAPIRLGFTATPIDKDPQRMIVQGLIGDIIDEVTWHEGQEIQMLSEPKLELIAVPRSSAISDMKRYKDIYAAGIVNNRLRNRLIVEKAVDLFSRNKTSIIFINHLEHGENLLRMASHSALRVDFVHGATDSETRNHIRKSLNNKDLDLVISSVVWREGINIPSIGAVILAGGGKSEIALLQTIGRALRRAPGKDEAIIVDLIDLGKYLSEHTCERLFVFKEIGLLP